MTKNWTRNQRRGGGRGRGEGAGGGTLGEKMKERAYTGNGIFNVAGSRRSWEKSDSIG